MIIKHSTMKPEESMLVICKNEHVLIYYDEDRQGWSINRSTIKSLGRISEVCKRIEGFREVAFITTEPLKEGEHGQQHSD
jgi:hypothetical protein